MIILSVSQKRTLTLWGASAPDQEEWIGERDECGDGSGDAACPEVHNDHHGDGRGSRDFLGAPVGMAQDSDHGRPPPRRRRSQPRLLPGGLEQSRLRAYQERG